MKRLRVFSVYLLGATLISGCDSSYHAFDGKSGFSYQALKADHYQLSYIGSNKDKQQDVAAMWNHTARELCRGGAYKIFNENSVEETASAKLTPKGQHDIIYKVEGELQCLAPNYALHMQNSFLFGKNFAANELVRGRTAD